MTNHIRNRNSSQPLQPQTILTSHHIFFFRLFLSDSNTKMLWLVKSTVRFQKNKYMRKNHCLYFDLVRRRKKSKVIIGIYCTKTDEVSNFSPKNSNTKAIT